MAEQMTIEIEGSRRAFSPGDTLSGRVTWTLERDPTDVELRLFWYTAGKGTQNVNVVRSVSLPATSQREQHPFEIAAPESPYSFSGKLVSLVWAIEAEAEPNEISARSEIVISPTGAEINLYANGEPEAS